jgi:hypothetical protein
MGNLPPPLTAQMNPRRVASSYLLSGLVNCGTCGKSLSGQVAKSGQFAYYVCGTLLKQGRGSCDCPYLSARRLEDLVVDKIKERVLTEENLRELVRLVNGEMDSAAAEYRERLKVVEGELAEVQRRLERLFDALETGMLGLADLSPRIQQLRHRQDQLQAAQTDLEGLLQDRREELKELSVITKYAADMRTLLQESSLVERKTFIKSFVKDIVVKGEEAILRYTLPLPPEGSDTETLPNQVLASVRYGGQYRTRTRDLLRVTWLPLRLWT